LGFPVCCGSHACLVPCGQYLSYFHVTTPAQSNPRSLCYVCCRRVQHFPVTHSKQTRHVREVTDGDTTY
jgi:hypothetical protein